jgi:asparagine synthase (glutamine-hydrolysing)
MLLPHHLAMLEATDLAAEPSRVEIRRPFRDRRLVELLLAVPPHQLYRPGESKRLLRRASAGRLPRAVLARRALTSLVPLARRGLAEREWSTVSDSLRAPDAVWPRYVDADWLWSRALAALTDRAGGVAGLVLWHCYSFERWRRTLATRGDFRIDCERRADRIHG